MKYILTAIVARRVENGWQFSVSYKEPAAEVVNSREFILSDIDDVLPHLHAIENGNPLP